MQEMQVRFLGREDPLEEGTATHSSILAWRIPWTEDPGGLQSIGSQRVGHDCSDLAHTWKGTSVLHVGVWLLSDPCWNVWSSWVLHSYLLHSVSGSPGLWRILLWLPAKDHKPCHYSEGKAPALSFLLFLTPGLFYSTPPFFTLASLIKSHENLRSLYSPPAPVCSQYYFYYAMVSFLLNCGYFVMIWGTMWSPPIVISKKGNTSFFCVPDFVFSILNSSTFFPKYLQAPLSIKTAFGFLSGRNFPYVDIIHPLYTVANGEALFLLLVCKGKLPSLKPSFWNYYLTMH